jgi:hypothetical protein
MIPASYKVGSTVLKRSDRHIPLIATLAAAQKNKELSEAHMQQLPQQQNQSDMQAPAFGRTNK